jgi:predicted RNase H-like nuclease (RuvC/YqgF family)
MCFEKIKILFSPKKQENEQIITDLNETINVLKIELTERDESIKTLTNQLESLNKANVQLQTQILELQTKLKDAEANMEVYMKIQALFGLDILADLVKTSNMIE